MSKAERASKTFEMQPFNQNGCLPSADGHAMRRYRCNTSNSLANAFQSLEAKNLEREPASRHDATQNNFQGQNRKNELPIYACKSKILDSIRLNRTTIIVGATGSGKSTQIPQLLYNEGYAESGMIGITQPRRVAAVTLSSRVSNEMQMGAVGELVGYNVRFQNVTSFRTRIKFLTDGMLLREALNDPTLKEYSVLVIDEAHERSLRTDILMGFVKTLLTKRKSFKVIIMSATLENDKVLKFFEPSELISIPGRQYHVTLYFTPKPEEDYVEASFITVLQIHLRSPSGGILVFLPGESDIIHLCRLLKEKLKVLRLLLTQKSASEVSTSEDALAGVQNAHTRKVTIGTDTYVLKNKHLNMVVLPIYSSLPVEEQHRVFVQPPGEIRKVVVATNIAETSVTIPGISYVVDCGLVKVNVFDSKLGMDALKIHAISQASAQQRSGRAGRECAGETYRLYTEDTFQQLEKHSKPEILNSDLTHVYLELKAMGVTNPAQFPLLDAPNHESFNQAGKTLLRIGAIDSNGEITDFGRKLTFLPLSPVLSKLVIHSIELGCTSEILSIVAMLTAESTFYNLYDSKGSQIITNNRKRLLHSDGDHLTLLNAYLLWTEAANKKAVCQDYGLSYNSMKRATSIRDQLQDILRNSLGIKEISECASMNEWYKVRQCLAMGCWLCAAHRSPTGDSYLTEVNRYPVYLHPSSVLFGRAPLPNWVIYSKCILTRKAFIRDVSVIDGRWLKEFVPRWFVTRT